MWTLKNSQEALDPKKRVRLTSIHKQMVESAARGKTDIVWGKAHGPRPRFFIIGDEPVIQDYMTGEPFSGVMNDVLVRTVDALDMKYGGVSMLDCYVTYFVKTTFQPGELTESMFMKEWLPAVQLEFALSGCEYVVPHTKQVQMMAGHIPQVPAIVKNGHAPTFTEKVQQIWQILKT